LYLGETGPRWGLACHPGRGRRDGPPVAGRLSGLLAPLDLLSHGLGGGLGSVGGRGKPVLPTLAFSFCFSTLWQKGSHVRPARHALPVAEPVRENSGKMKLFIIYFPVVIPVHLSHEI